MVAEMFSHINLSEVDDTIKAVDEGVYTFEINKLEPKYVKITKPGSEYEGQEVLVLKGSYTIVDDEKYSGRKIWQDFFTPFKGAQIGLKRQMNATGVVQAAGEDLIQYAQQFATLNPPARFQAPLKKVADRRDPTGPAKNEIDLFQAKPAN